MDNNKEEGNLVSFRVFIARDGNIISEFKHLPIEDIEKVFPEDEIPLIKKVVKEGCFKLEGLHDFLEKEVKSLANV
tara:strand:+ start:1664 stop:1891 length:228 start_codon:yes stop_codon:yes gene_type:complete